MSDKNNLLILNWFSLQSYIFPSPADDVRTYQRPT